MKTKSFCTIAVAALLALAAAQPVLAANPAGSSSRYGAEIRKVELSGYTLTYKLIDIHTMNVTTVMPKSSDDGGHMKSHHLMVFVTRPDGRPVTQGKAGYLVVQPNKAEAKDIAVPMDGGFGTDVDLSFNGDYTITAKLALPDADLVDTFIHTVK